ncbi:hypothetical protein Zmor_012634 [Zophobas morio]|uniref:Envelope fusion protein n=1 Tax=Zophobas morio TaxID=2755281 RepID=A0AA38ICJ6_9CUCU|nr:hypothetical protein Zmor_012634 [Zophobas morio]
MQYSRLKDLSACKTIYEDDFICQDAITYMVNQHPVCEILLKVQQLDHIPSDCQTKTVKSNVQIWHKLRKNQWLYVLSRPVFGTISCEGSHRIFDVNFERGVGIFTMDSKCKCFTPMTALTSSSNYSSNYTNFIPKININEDNCCVEKMKYLQNQKMIPLSINSLNLDELRHAKHKLQKFEEALQRNMENPFIVTHSEWYNVVIGVLLLLALIPILYYIIRKCCCKLSYRRILFCKFSRSVYKRRSNTPIQLGSFKEIAKEDVEDDEEDEETFIKPNSPDVPGPSAPLYPILTRSRSKSILSNDFAKKLKI